MKSRLLVAIPGIAVAIGFVMVGDLLFAGAVAIIGILGLIELRMLLAEYRPLRWASDAGALVCVLLPLTATAPELPVSSTGPLVAGWQLVTGCVVILTLSAIGGLIAANRDEISLRVAVTMASALYIGLPLGCLVALRELPFGASAVANVLVGTWAFDTFSYFGGKAWGRRPIAPRTSPKKTLEGAVVGFGGAIVAMMVAGLYIDWISWWQSAGLGAAICAAAFLGDLFESLMKRDAGVKDSGTLLGGHGGILDRFDALLLSAPVCYLITVAILSGYVPAT